MAAVPALEEVLAGPVLRRCEPTAVCVWLATSTPLEVRVVVRRASGPSHERLGAGPARRVRLGPGLWLHLATARPETGGFPTDTLLAYDLEVSAEGDGPGRGLAALGMVRGSRSLTYDGQELPTFFLRGPATAALNLLHGSCRLLHGKGEDAFLAADDLLAATTTDLSRRPSGLLLTGDQVYADEVGGPLIGHLTRLGTALLGPGDDTSVAGLPPLSGIPVYGRQDLAEHQAGFTSGKAANHLFSLGEFAAAYLVAWREANWPARWPPVEEVVPDDGGDGRERDRLRAQYQDELAKLDTARRAVPAAARVLANVPTYTCFDDHDVTDDWNLTREWRQRVAASPAGRRVVANALAAYWAFQAWGNDPEAFGDDFVETVSAGPGSGEDGATAYEDALWGFDAWSYTVPTDPPVVVLDTRTQRSFDSDQGAARLIGDGEARRLVRLCRAAGVQAPGPVVMVSPVPVFGLELQERRQKFLAGKLGPYEVDFEAWHSNLAGFVDFMDLLIGELGLRRLVIVSGDVHYGLNVAASFRIDEAELQVAQVVSSSFKHSGALEKSALHLLGRLVRSGAERVGWDRPPEMGEATSLARRLLARPVNTDEWSEDAPVFLPARLESKVGPGRGRRYHETRTYLDPEERPKWMVVGENNVGFLSFDPADGTVEHRLLARSGPHDTTTYTVRFPRGTPVPADRTY